jgi:hypothetical protein
MRTLEHNDCAAEVVQRREVSAKGPKGDSAPVQHSPDHGAAGQLSASAEGGESIRGAA